LRSVPKFIDLSLRSVGPFEKGHFQIEKELYVIYKQYLFYVLH